MTEQKHSEELASVNPDQLAWAATAHWDVASIQRAMPKGQEAGRILTQNALKVLLSCLKNTPQDRGETRYAGEEMNDGIGKESA